MFRPSTLLTLTKKQQGKESIPVKIRYPTRA